MCLTFNWHKRPNWRELLEHNFLMNPSHNIKKTYVDVSKIRSHEEFTSWALINRLD